MTSRGFRESRAEIRLTHVVQTDRSQNESYSKHLAMFNTQPVVHISSATDVALAGPTLNKSFESGGGGGGEGHSVCCAAGGGPVLAHFLQLLMRRLLLEDLPRESVDRSSAALLPLIIAQPAAFHFIGEGSVPHPDCT